MKKYGMKEYGKNSYIGVVRVGKNLAVLAVMNKPNHGLINTVTKPITIRRANNYLAKMLQTQNRNCIKPNDWPEYDAD